jgi:diguanylate cyclase (GGDEF)-like protein
MAINDLKSDEKSSDAISDEALKGVVQQAKHIQDLVEQSAQELSSVNDGLAKGIEQSVIPLQMQTELDKSQAVENKVQDAADKLASVNSTLKAEVLVRQGLESELVISKLSEQRIRHAAFHDSLTGLPNRALFEDRLEHGIAQAKRHNRTLAVMFLDLDKFKSINDILGHDVGDTVLKMIAQKLLENTREDDTVCRFGGDEFVYLLTEIENAESLIQIAKNIAVAIRLHCQMQVENLVVRPSIGIAVYPKDGHNGAELIKSADTAMFIAKRNKSEFAFAS